MKKETNNRRIFVRLMAKKPVYVDFEKHFGLFGELESCYIVKESLVQTKNKYTYIGYVVFKEPEPAAMLIKKYKLKFEEYHFLIKQINKKSDSGSSSEKQSKNVSKENPDNEYSFLDQKDNKEKRKHKS